MEIVKRIVIEDLIKRMDDKEDVLNCSAIAFEIGSNRFTVKITDEGIEIYKMGNINDGVIWQRAMSANKILLT